jgi:hypothetical protein
MGAKQQGKTKGSPDPEKKVFFVEKIPFDMETGALHFRGQMQTRTSNDALRLELGGAKATGITRHGCNCKKPHKKGVETTSKNEQVTKPCKTGVF